MYSYFDVRTGLNLKEILFYLRKSRADDPMLSVEEVLAKHESRLDEWCERNLGGLVPAENRFKEVVSGESIADRPEFQKVLRLIESEDIKAVMVVEISRLGRPDTAEIGYLSKIFRFTNTLVITPERTFNVADEFEREMFESELKRGNFYLEYSKKLLRNGRELSVKSGNYVGSKPLYGYDKTIVIDGKRKCPTLIINEEQAEYVRKIFEWYVYENIGTQAISNRLNDLGVKSPKGLLWTPDTIRDMLENVHYIGKVRWNARKGVCVVSNGQFLKTRPKASEDEVILCDGKHEPLISEELFNLAQEKRGKCHRTVDNRHLRNPLASLLFCECGRAMSYRHSTRGNLKYRREPRLVCNDQHNCGNGSCSVDEIMEFVVEALHNRIADFKFEIENQDNSAIVFQEKHLRNLEKKLKEIEAKEVAMYEGQLSPETRMPQNIFLTVKNNLEKEREELETAINKARSMVTKPLAYEKHLVTLEKALSALSDPNASVEDKNQFLKACIEKIEYKREAPHRLLGKGVGKQWVMQPIEAKVILKV